MTIPPHLRSLIWPVTACLALLLLRSLPPFPNEAAEVAALSARTVLAAGLILYLAGSGSDFLLPHIWKPYVLILRPLIGMVVLVPAAYLLNFFWDMRVVTVILLTSAAALGVWSARRGSGPPIWSSEGLVPAIAGVALLLVAILPHLAQQALGLLAMSYDEEVYVNLAQYLLHYPAGSDMPGFAAPVQSLGAPGARAEGWAFQYLLAATSYVSGVEVFNAYLPTAYVLLALSVPGWFVFYRYALALPRFAAVVAAVLYALQGLPLWFASYGYGKQVGWIALTPLALAAIVLAVRQPGRRTVILAGLSAGSLIALEARVGTTHVALTIAGLGCYWLVANRGASLSRRIVAITAVAVASAAAPLWYFVQSYLTGGGAASLFTSGQGTMLSWGPGLSGFPTVQVLLGLEPNELARDLFVSTSVVGMDGLGAVLDLWLLPMTVLTVLAAAAGAIRVGRSEPVGLFLMVGLAFWMIATRTILVFPYGYFKLFGVIAPVWVGLAVAGVSWLWNSRLKGILPRSTAILRGTALVLSCLFTLFFLRNSFHSAMFSAQGWGLSVPPSFVQDIAAFGRVTEPGARVFVAQASDYQAPEDRVILRKGHRLAMQSKGELGKVWADRIHTLIDTSLVGRQIFGTFRSENYSWSKTLQSGDYDYYLLPKQEDPRVRQLDSIDKLVEGAGFALFRSPAKADSVSTEQLLAYKGTTSVEVDKPLVLAVSPQGFVLDPSGANNTGAGAAARSLRFAFMALRETTVDVQVGQDRRRIALDPGLSWYTSPSAELPAEITVSTDRLAPVKVVAIRSIPATAEALDRSPNTVLSWNLVNRGDGVDVDLWFANPAGDAKSAVASVAAGKETPLALAVPSTGEHWVLRFPLQGIPTQHRDGQESRPLEPVDWLEKGGGELQLRLKLGREQPKQIQLARASIVNGQITQLDTPSNLAELRLWGHDDRPKEKLPPDPATLEGKVVRSPGSYLYQVGDGRRHWISDDGPTNLDETVQLSPEQLWLIPPGLPTGDR